MVEALAAAGVLSLADFVSFLSVLSIFVVDSDDSVLVDFSLELFELFDLRLSLMYQPEPLNTTPTF
ncbi:MAG TPA: hypothetical protein VEQ36_07480 [Thermomicrobiales bacterium]|nr:hypothetical protein [Thermomicrobiales bacterium]